MQSITVRTDVLRERGRDKGEDRVCVCVCRVGEGDGGGGRRKRKTENSNSNILFKKIILFRFSQSLMASGSSPC